MASSSLLYLVFALLPILAQSQYSIFSRGPPPPRPPPGFQYYGPSSTTSYLGSASSPPTRRVPPPPGSSIMSWLGSQMPSLKFPSFRRQHPSQKTKQASYSFGGSSGGGSAYHSYNNYKHPNALPTGGQGQGVQHHYMPPGSSSQGTGMTPENTVFQIISADGTSRYQAAPPAGYENFFGQGTVAQEMLSQTRGQLHGHGHGQQPQPQYQYQAQPTPQAPAYPSYNPNGNQFYTIVPQGPAPAPVPVQQQQRPSHNIELVPSQMVFTDKQVLTHTQGPEYFKVLREMGSPLGSTGLPLFYQQQEQQQQQQQQEQQQAQVQYQPQQFQPHPTLSPAITYQYVETPVQNQQSQQDYQGQIVQSLGDNLSSLFQGVKPDVAPIVDMAQSQSQTQGQGQQVQSDQGQGQGQGQDASTSQSQQIPQIASPPQDLETSASGYYPSFAAPPGVQILPGTGPDGSPSFEVFADANAPTYGNGHPFDINQLVGMIEPGAQIDPLTDIVKDDQQA